MIKVLFVCLGNICRSPMAEAVFNHIAKEKGLSEKIMADSCGTEGYHTGQPPHQGTREILDKHGISYENIRASKLKARSLKEYDYIIAMDGQNLEDILSYKNSSSKANIMLLSNFSKGKWVSVPDPWYTGNFELTYSLITDGCGGLIDFIINEEL